MAIPFAAQRRDLGTLGADQPTEQHERRHRCRTQEQDGEHERQLAEARHVLLQGRIRGLLRAGLNLGAGPGGGGERGGDVRGVGTRFEPDEHLAHAGDRVEGIERGRRREQDAEVVGRGEQVLTASGGPDVLRRHHARGDVDRLPSTRDANLDRVAGVQLEVSGHVVLDEQARTGRVRTDRYRSLDRIDPVDLRLTSVGKLDDAPEQYMIATDPDGDVG